MSHKLWHSQQVQSASHKSTICDVISRTVITQHVYLVMYPVTCMMVVYGVSPWTVLRSRVQTHHMLGQHQTMYCPPDRYVCLLHSNYSHHHKCMWHVSYLIGHVCMCLLHEGVVTLIHFTLWGIIKLHPHTKIKYSKTCCQSLITDGTAIMHLKWVHGKWIYWTKPKQNTPPPLATRWSFTQHHHHLEIAQLCDVYSQTLQGESLETALATSQITLTASDILAIPAIQHGTGSCCLTHW